MRPVRIPSHHSEDQAYREKFLDGKGFIPRLSSTLNATEMWMKSISSEEKYMRLESSID
jgi:hypothetical protein